ncbi:MAG: hypothetical protein ACRDTD_05920, partial [Pseudonocardiaceae bacterium]
MTPPSPLMEPGGEHGSAVGVTAWADAPSLGHEREAAASVWFVVGLESTLQAIMVGVVIGYCRAFVLVRVVMRRVGMGVEWRGNAVLGALLSELDWSPSRLTEVVNGVLGPGYVGRSTVSEWVNQDRVPRDPLPTVVAHLISDAVEREVSVAQVWSGRAQPAEFWVPADAGLQLPWTAMGTVEVLDDWLRHPGGAIRMDRRIFLAVSGAT